MTPEEARYGALRAAASSCGGWQTQNVGTIGGQDGAGEGNPAGGERSYHVSTQPTTPSALDQALAAVESAEAQLGNDTTTLTIAQAALQQLQTQQATDLANFQAQQASALAAAQTTVSNAQTAVTNDTTAYTTAVDNAIAALQASLNNLSNPPASGGGGTSSSS